MQKTLRRATYLGCTALLFAAASLLQARHAVAAEAITMAIVADPGYEAAAWAMMNGKVKDPNVEVKVTTLPLPALLQAVMTQQYNVIPTGVLSVPQLLESGIPARIMGTMIRYKPSGHTADLWVLKDSPIKSLKDLKGKTIAVTSVEAQNIISLRAVASERHGFNVSVVGGDFKWAEIPQAQFEAALKAGRVDAVAFGNVMSYSMAQKGAYRSVLQGSQELQEMYGGPMASVLMIGYGPDMQKRPAAYAAFAKLAKASADYAMANQDEVFNAVAPKYKIDAADLRGWFTQYAVMPNALGPTDKTVFVKSWNSGQKLGVLKTVPRSVDELIWSQAVPE